MGWEDFFSRLCLRRVLCNLENCIESIVRLQFRFTMFMEGESIQLSVHTIYNVFEEFVNNISYVKHLINVSNWQTLQRFNFFFNYTYSFTHFFSNLKEVSLMKYYMLHYSKTLLLDVLKIIKFFLTRKVGTCRCFYSVLKMLFHTT